MKKVVQVLIMIVALIVGKSYVLRIEMVEGAINIDAFENGDVVPLTDRSKR